MTSAVRLLRSSSNGNGTAATGLLPHALDDPIVSHVCLAEGATGENGNNAPRTYRPGLGISCVSMTTDPATTWQDHRTCMAANCSIATSRVASEQCAMEKCFTTWETLSSSLCVPLDLPYLVQQSVYLPALPTLPSSLDANATSLFAHAHADHLAQRGLGPLNRTDHSPPYTLGVCLPGPPVGFPCAPSMFSATGGFPLPNNGPLAVPDLAGTNSTHRRADPLVLKSAVSVAPFQPVISTLHDPSVLPMAPVLFYDPQGAQQVQKNVSQANIYMLVHCLTVDGGSGVTSAFTATAPPGMPCRVDADCRFSPCIESKCALAVQKGDPNLQYAASSFSLGLVLAFGSVPLIVLTILFVMSRATMLDVFVRAAAITSTWVRGVGDTLSWSTVQREVTLKPITSARMLEAPSVLGTGTTPSMISLPHYDDDGGALPSFPPSLRAATASLSDVGPDISLEPTPAVGRS
ncbi:hypothetical protein BC828DRAFT_402213 [Blastocladiella britannica]|nr:hypothetical protein BC828DRAFT_402213 [Blastocladiella britannica]